MLDTCGVCAGVILESEEKIKCAGPCEELFHLSCAIESESENSREVKDCKPRNLPSNLNSSSSIVQNDFFDQVLSDASKLENILNMVPDLQRSGIRDLSDRSDLLVSLNKEILQLRSENATLGNRVRDLDVKVNNDIVMFDELKKMVGDLTSKLDETSRSVVDLKDEIKCIRSLNKKVEDENASLVNQVRDLENKLGELKSSLKQHIENRVIHTEIPSVKTNEEKESLSCKPVLQEHKNDENSSLVPVRRNIKFSMAAQVYKKFLELNKDQDMFKSWLTSVCGANSRWSRECFQCLRDWDITFEVLVQQQQQTITKKLQLLDTKNQGTITQNTENRVTHTKIASVKTNAEKESLSCNNLFHSHKNEENSLATRPKLLEVPVRRDVQYSLDNNSLDCNMENKPVTELAGIGETDADRLLADLMYLPTLPIEFYLDLSKNIII
ncbi:paramyosin-like [Macrosteles quadrilineatus]|uniref:paramyosin-like n=1 Tax=Macrosteles quadrilineatus TaxID=74068 RepID=UPI0023E20FEA|nr:paramyosin-like [Macrosteles quadrilineatus]